MASAPGRAAEPGTTVGPVVVQGHTAKSRSLSSKTSEFVRTHARESPAGVLARWMEPVCPVTAGISPAFGKFVVRRIAEVAARIGAPHAKPCIRTNVWVVFTTVPQELMDDVRKNHPQLLGFHYLVQEKDLATFHGPIEAWHMTATRWDDGQSTLDQPNANAKTPGLEGGAPWVAVMDFSRIKQERSSEFVHALVVVDVNAIDGQPIGAVADQIAFAALSDSGPREGCSPLPSVLDASDQACPSSASPQTLSAYDQAFLKGLYSSDAEEVLQEERGSIMQEIRWEAPRPAPASDGG